MRFLCLHGMGTNSDVYEAQLAPIRAHMNQSHEFVFVDGQIECEAAEGIDGLFPGPFYCYYSKPTECQLQDAFDLIAEVISEDGPFDGVFGFSQGGALAASLLLHHAKSHPHADPPFSLAIFTCASLPFDIGTSRRALSYHTGVCPQSGQVHVRDCGPGDSIDASTVNGFVAALTAGDVPLQRYHPEKEKLRLGVPTLHVMGRRDPFVAQSYLLGDLCEAVERNTLVHELGHKLPRDGPFARKAAAAVEAMVYRVLYRS